MPLTCSYHYNVSNHRLDVHVSKGFDDGLFISSVCACGELWAIIMDAGTGFTQQVGGPALAGGMRGRGMALGHHHGRRHRLHAAGEWRRSPLESKEVRGRDGSAGRALTRATACNPAPPA